MNNKDAFITLLEIADIYSIPLSTLRRWAAERRFPLYKISNRIRVSKSEFRDWIEQFKIMQENNNNEKTGE